MDAQLRKMFTNKIYIEAFTGENGAGDVTYEAPVETKGLVVGRTSLMVDNSGAHSTSQQILYLEASIVDNAYYLGNTFYVEGGLTIKERDRVTLPTGSTLIVERITPRYNALGTIDFLEVYF